jgi:YHS domain-containing protein
MIRLTNKRKALIAGAAGICFAVPAALSSITPLGLSIARADQPPAARNPNLVLHSAIERELSELGIDAPQGASGIQLTAGEGPSPIQQTGGGVPSGFNQQQYQSEVQRQLQMLYQQDGRTMPNMAPTPQISPEVWQEYQQQHGSLPTSGRRPSGWDWLKPQTWRRQWQRTFSRSNRAEPQPPEPPEFNPDGEATDTLPQFPNATVNQPQDATPQFQMLPAQQPQPQPMIRPAAPAAQADAEQPRLFPGLLEEMQEPIQEQQPVTNTPTLILLPAKPEGELTEPLAAPGIDQPGQEIPFVADEPARPEPELDLGPRQQLPTLEMTVEQWDHEPEITPQPAADDPLANPFPELSEGVADEQSGPYSGMELELDPFAEPVPGSNDSLAHGENPFAPFVERSAGANVSVQPQLPPVEEVGPSLQGPGLPQEPAGLPAIEPQELPATTATEPAVPSSKSPEVQEKMARIAARRGLTGLKGFCPVVLRDYRDLEDARSEYTVIYAGKQYWFSSEQAKQAFLLTPDAYAPVHGGVDLVHFEETGEEVEGTLDYAAWFQGRLHLFSSAENKAAFIASPRAYSHED